MAEQKEPAKADKLRSLPVNQLQRGRFQPRQAIDGIALKKLAESVLSEGVVQPLFVRRVSRGKFEIVAGERRWHAAKMAGLKKVPTVVRDVSDKTALSISLVENLHREDLNPMDQAYAVQQLVETFSMTHQQVADAVGRSRATITNLLRLLELPAGVRTMLAEGKLDVGHARTLLSLPPDQRQSAAEQAVASRMSVRDVERMVKHSAAPQSRPAPQEREPDAGPVRLQQRLKERVGTGTRIRRQKNGWSLNVAFSDLEELHDLLETIDELLETLSPARPRGQGPAV